MFATKPSQEKLKNTLPENRRSPSPRPSDRQSYNNTSAQSNVQFFSSAEETAFFSHKKLRSASFHSNEFQPYTPVYDKRLIKVINATKPGNTDALFYSNARLNKHLSIYSINSSSRLTPITPSTDVESNDDEYNEMYQAGMTV